MEYEKIKQLMDDMGNSKLTSIDIEFPDGIKIKMEKKNENNSVTISNNEVVETKLNDVKFNNDSEIDVKNETKNEENLNIIKSPMVGTFYLKPSPTSEPYVEIGKEIKKGDTVCIIEAMKLMNEIESEFNGKIVKVYVNDGETVEYGKPLFAVE